eukprot:scpid62092/ scgid30568/ 
MADLMSIKSTSAVLSSPSSPAGRSFTFSIGPNLSKASLIPSSSQDSGTPKTIRWRLSRAMVSTDSTGRSIGKTCCYGTTKRHERLLPPKKNTTKICAGDGVWEKKSSSPIYIDLVCTQAALPCHAMPGRVCEVRSDYHARRWTLARSPARYE